LSNTVTCVRSDQAAVDREALAAGETLVDAALQDRLKQAAQEVALPKAAMAVLGEGGVVWDASLQTEVAKPAIGEVQVNLLAEASLGADAEAVADDQHPDHQLRIDRRPPSRAVEWSEVSPQL